MSDYEASENGKILSNYTETHSCRQALICHLFNYYLKSLRFVENDLKCSYCIVIFLITSNKAQ